MPREVSRRTSKPPEMKGKVSRPDMVRTVTPEMIEAAKTPAGGWTREQLAEWGVPWPPPKGWRDAIRRGKDMDHYVGSINPTDGKSKGATGYVDNND